MIERISQYRNMWLFVFFDLPTETKQERKAYATFRKNLLTNGFTMFQYSIYIRNCPSFENLNVHIKRVKSFLPGCGKVVIFYVTEKQFANMELFYGSKSQKIMTAPQQLELF